MATPLPLQKDGTSTLALEIMTALHILRVVLEPDATRTDRTVSDSVFRCLYSDDAMVRFRAVERTLSGHESHGAIRGVLEDLLRIRDEFTRQPSGNILVEAARNYLNSEKIAALIATAKRDLGLPGVQG